MKRVSLILAILTMILSLGAGISFTTVNASAVEVPIISTNDFHGNIDEAVGGKNPGLLKIAQTVVNEREANKNLIFVSAGDSYQGTAPSNLSYGMPIAEAFNALDMDIFVPGNHEYDWNANGLNYLPEWEKLGGFKTVSANIFDKATDTPASYVKPYEVIERSGKKIGLIGLTTIETAVKSNPENVSNITFKEYTTVTQKYIDELRNTVGVDAVVIVSHLSSYQDATTKKITGESADLLATLKGVDAMFTGHSHQTVNGTVNGVPVLQGNYAGRLLSKMVLSFDDAGNVTVKASHIVPKDTKVDLTNPVVAQVNQIIEDNRKDLGSLLDEVIGTTTTTLDHERYESENQPSELGQLVSKAMVEKSGAQIGYVNGGNIRTSIDAGDITIGEAYTILPFDNVIDVVSMKTKDLKSVVEQGILPVSEGSLDVSWGQYYGMTVMYDPSRPYGDRIIEMYYNNPKTGKSELMKSEDAYTVAIPDFIYVGGDGYNFSKSTLVKETGLDIRTVFIDYVKSHTPLNFEREDLLQKMNYAPEIKGTDDITIQRGAKFDALKDVSATDKEDGNITSKITVSGKVNTKKTGTYTLTYTVKDNQGKETRVNREVTVIKRSEVCQNNFIKDGLYRHHVNNCKQQVIDYTLQFATLDQEGEAIRAYEYYENPVYVLGEVPKSYGIKWEFTMSKCEENTKKEQHGVVVSAVKYTKGTETINTKYTYAAHAQYGAGHEKKIIKIERF